ncbi:MAG TPA: DUF4445 domain-containing protein, partial [Ignisphaera aggregans]|nr:DUF4445 domain-containing protein [Ignisphaera aggregans]
MPIVEIGSRAIEVAYGSNLGQELAKHGILHLPCGGRGLCGKCLVKVWGEVSPPTAIERLRGVKPPLRLACQVRVLGDTRVELISMPQKPVSVLSMDIPIREPRPMFRVVNEVPAVSKALLFDYSKCGETVKSLVEVWDLGFLGAVEGDCDIYRAILIDVGTTTIHYAIVDEKGNTLWEDRKLNPQLVYGADVVTRISKALEDRDVYRNLVEILRKEVIELVDSTPCIAMGFSCWKQCYDEFSPWSTPRNSCSKTVST